MWCKRSCCVALLVSGLLAETAWAQTERQVALRVVPGLSFVRGVFGDDRPEGMAKAAPSIGLQLCSSRSADRAIVFEGTVWPQWPENPHFPGRYGAADLAAGWRRGNRAYVRFGVGVTLYWPWPHRASGTRDRGLAFGGVLAVGRDLRDPGDVAVEAVARAAIAPGLGFLSIGAQVPLGRCTQ